MNPQSKKPEKIKKKGKKLVPRDYGKNPGGLARHPHATFN
jgi:hypothetical protein